MAFDVSLRNSGAGSFDIALTDAAAVQPPDWTFVGAGAQFSGIFGSVTPTVPAGTVSGDLLVAVTSTLIQPPAANSGWTNLVNTTSGLSVWYRYQNGAVTSITVTPSSSGGVGQIFAYRGISAFDLVGTVATGSSTSPSAPAITTTAANDLVLSIFGIGGTSGALSGPSGVTVRGSQTSSGGSNVGFSFGDENKTSAGATTARTLTTTTSVSWAAVTIGFKQTVAGAATVAITSASGAGAVGTLGKSGSATKAITGVSGTGSAGTVTANGTGGGVDGSITITGVSGAGSVGTLGKSGSATNSIASASGTGSVGTLAKSGSAIKALTGVSGTGIAGALTAKADVSKAITGVSGAGTAGALTFSGSANKSISGVSGTGSAGTVSASGGVSPDATIAIVGVSGAGSAGTITAKSDVAIPISGVSGVGTAGTATASGAAAVSLSGVSGSGQVGSFASAGDPYWDSVVLAVPFDADTADLKGHTVIETVNVAAGTGKFNGGYGPASAAVAKLNYGNSADWNLGAGNFTIDLWVNPDGASTRSYMVQIADSFASKIALNLSRNGTAIELQGTFAGGTTFFNAASALGFLPTGAYAHVELTRYNGDFFVRVNGALACSSLGVTTAIYWTADTSLSLGGGNTPAFIPGVMDDVRVTKGIARHTTDFTAPTTANPTSGSVLLVSGGANTTLSAVSGAGLAGTVSASVVLDASTSITGVAGTGLAGTVSASGSATADGSVSIAGVAGTGSAGTVFAAGSTPATVSIAGAAGAGQAGAITAIGSAVASISGASGAGDAGAMAVVGNAITGMTGVSGLGQAGTLASSTDITVAVSGVSGTGLAGTTVARSDATVAIAGVSGVGQAGDAAYSASAAAFIAGVFGTGQARPVSASGTVAGGAVWPLPGQVQAGVVYGPTGVEYTGTYVDKIRLELETGRLAKPIGASLSILL